MDTNAHNLTVSVVASTPPCVSVDRAYWMANEVELGAVLCPSVLASILAELEGDAASVADSAA